MKRTRDLSMLYGAVAGFLLFAAGFAVLNYVMDFGGAWYNSTNFDRYFSFPEGTQYEQTNSHGGFLGDGVTTIIAQIPAASSQEFIQLLWAKGFTDAPIPEKLQNQLRAVPETCMAADIPNSLWWFQDESPDGNRDWYMNYTLHLYDPAASIYYYIEFDS